MDGGLPRSQFETLYTELCSIQNKEYQFLAAIQGVDINEGKEETVTKEENLAKVPLFGDPEDYSKLSEEEQNDLSQKMMNRHKSWATETKA